MIQLLRSTVPAFIFGIVAFTSCSKSETINTEEELQGTWQISGISSNIAYDWDGDGRTETDILGMYTACDRDIVLYFDGGGTGQVREGCDAPLVYMNYQLNGNFLAIQLPSGDVNLDIVSFSTNTLRGRDEVLVDGRNITITYTLNRR